MDTSDQAKVVEAIIDMVNGMQVGDAMIALASVVITILHDCVARDDGERVARMVADHIVAGYLASREVAVEHRRRRLN